MNLHELICSLEHACQPILSEAVHLVIERRHGVIYLFLVREGYWQPVRLMPQDWEAEAAVFRQRVEEAWVTLSTLVKGEKRLKRELRRPLEEAREETARLVGALQAQQERLVGMLGEESG